MKTFVSWSPFALGVVGFVVMGLLTGMPIVVVIALPVAATVLALGLWRTLLRPPLVAAVVATLLVGIAIQAVPYGRDHTNPPVTGEPGWASAETRDLMVRACYSCHSNEVERPFYAHIAPVSWALESHIRAGRAAVNYSTFAGDEGEADESVEVILDGSMPPAHFTRFGLHPEARLTDAEVATLVAGLRATPGLSDDDDRNDRNDRDDDRDDDNNDDDNDDDTDSISR